MVAREKRQGTEWDIVVFLRESPNRKSDEKRQVCKAMVLKRESTLMGAWKNEWRQRLDLNLHALQGCATERSSRVYLISNPRSTTDQDRRDWIPSVLALP
jgi:hypothetical protein